MAQTFVFEIVSPEKLLFSRPVAMATIPGSEGAYGVLPGHAPLITKIKAGVIDIYADDNAEPNERIFVGGGFAEVTATRCTVLATEAVALKELDKSQLSEQIKELTSKIDRSDQTNLGILLEQKEVLTAKIEALV